MIRNMYIRSGELVTILGVKWQIKSKLIKSLRSRLAHYDYQYTSVYRIERDAFEAV